MRGAECRFVAGFPVSAVSAVRFEGCRPSRSVSTPSVPVATRSGVIAWVSGVADLISTRSVPFRPSFRWIFDSLGVFSTLTIPVSTHLPSGFSSLSGGFDTLGVPLPTLMLMVSTLSDPLTVFRPSFPRGIPCLTLPLFQPFISVVCSMSQTPFFTFPGFLIYFTVINRFGVSTLPPPAIRKRGRG